MLQYAVAWSRWVRGDTVRMLLRDRSTRWKAVWAWARDQMSKLQGPTGPENSAQALAQGVTSQASATPEAPAQAELRPTCAGPAMSKPSARRMAFPRQPATHFNAYGQTPGYVQRSSMRTLVAKSFCPGALC
jgi:hypothetical protein